MRSIGWSKFARDRHNPEAGYSYFVGTDAELECLIQTNWHKREVGVGAESMDDVCVVPVPADRFRCAYTKVSEASDPVAEIHRRQAHEDPSIRVRANGPAVEAKFAKVVLYSASELLKNDGERSTDCDWEIVCIIASPVENEPMHPLAMARNQLEKPGGTPRHYTSEEWAEAVWYWSQYVMRL